MSEGYNNQEYGSGGYPQLQQPPMQGMPQPQQGMPQPQQPPMQGMPQSQQPPMQGIPQPQPGYPYGGYPQGQQPPMGGTPQHGYPGEQSPKKGLGIGAIIGIVVGTVALVGIVLMLVVFPMIGRHEDTPSDQDDTTTAMPASTDDSGTDGTSDATQDAGTSDATDNSADGTDGATSPTPDGNPSGVAVDINSLADDWTRGEVNVAGKGYRLFESTYADLTANGWAISEYSRGEIDQNSGSLVINAGQWQTFTFDNAAFPDCSLTVGLGNIGSAPINYDQCVITYLAGRVPHSDGKLAYDKVYDFVVSKGIKFGMTDQEVLTAFGQPDDHGSVYEDAESGYKSIKYVIIGDGAPFHRNYYHLDFGFKLDDDGQYRINDMSIGV